MRVTSSKVGGGAETLPSSPSFRGPDVGGAKTLLVSPLFSWARMGVVV